MIYSYSIMTKKAKNLFKKNKGKGSSRKRLPPLKVTYIHVEPKNKEEVKEQGEKLYRVFETLFEDVMKARQIKK